VGSIISETLETTTFLAVVKMSIDPTIKLPSDSVAEILSNGLLGDKFLAIVPGAADDTLPPGGVIKFTQSPMSLENLIGQYIFSQGQSKKGDGDADKPK
jgi:phospholipid/cholesterol/gamma-HCH transport system substrate-binding protein